MAILQVRPVDGQGDSTYQVPVTLRLTDWHGNPVTGLIQASGSPVVPVLHLSTDAAGQLDVDLIPNAEIEPAGTVWTLTVGNGPPVKLRKATWPQTVHEALATDLGPLSPIVGAQGPPGSASATHYEHTQDVLDDQWVIHHNLGYRPPAVYLLDQQGNQMLAPYEHLTLNTLVVTFLSPQAGTAYI